MVSILHQARTAIALGVLLLCGGCATSFDPGNAARIQTIALTGFEEPSYHVQDRFVLNTSAVSGPADFETLMAGQNLHLGAEYKAAIAQGLRGAGYRIVEDAGAADAVLDGKLDGAPPNGTPMYESAASAFEPEYSVRVKLLDGKTKSTLFYELYVYRDNSLKPLDGSILIRPDPKYSFRDAADLFGNPALAAAGFRAPEPLVVQSIATLLKKP